MNTNIRLLLIIAILLIVNLIGSAYFFRLDLTQEKRYSLSEVSQQTVRSLSHIRQKDQAQPVPMYISIFIEGEFPPEIRKFQDAIRTTLGEMRMYSRGFLEYEFIDPSSNTELLKAFKEKRLLPIPVRIQSSASEFSRKDMYPYALVRYRDRELYVDLLKGSAFNRQVDFAKAESDLEYKLISSIKTLQAERNGTVIILQGHGETPVFLEEGKGNPEMAQLYTILTNAGYQIFTFDRAQQEGLAIPDVDVLLILQPKIPFTERDKYEIDQYLIRGGSVFWMMNEQKVDLKLYRNQATMTSLRNLNLADMFMNYGFKLNTDLVQDYNAEKTEVFLETAAGGEIQEHPWPFFPMIFEFPNHPVTRNVDAVLLRYASTIDTFHQAEVRKSVFLNTSPLSRKLQNVQFIDINPYITNYPPQNIFNQGPQITGLMLEGIFTSVFNGRAIPTDSLSPNPPTAIFGPKNNPVAPGKMAVITDGEFYLGKNFRGERGNIPYDNASLILNVVDYLAGDNALTQIRSKDVVVRRLDKVKVNQYQHIIRASNLILPVLLIVFFGGLRYYLRKRRNERLKV